MKIAQRGFLKGITLLLCAAIGVHATTLARLSLDQLATAANAVARVRCTSSESRWENGTIWTTVNFNVVETMKGALPAQIVVRLPGGRVGHLTATVDGTPKFIAGEEAIVFLEKSPMGGFSIAAWVEGTFRIGLDARTAFETVTQESSSFAVFDTATRAFRTEGIRRMPMAQFREKIGNAVAGPQEKIR